MLQKIDDCVKYIYQMVCGSSKAENMQYKLYAGKKSYWLVGICDNLTDHIYCSDRNPKSNGFGGREITFPLEGHGRIILQGPWSTSYESFHKDTGIDLEIKQISQCVVSRKIKYLNDGYNCIFEDIIYFDRKPVIGPADRAKKIAQQKANELNESLHVFIEYEGWGHGYMVKPELKEAPDA